MSLLDWLFKKKQKKEREQFQVEEPAVTVNLKDEKSVQDYVLNLCEQMIEVSKEMEDVRQEYKQVSAHLNDIQLVESLEGEQKALLLDVANNVSKLLNSRNGYLNAEQKISDEIFRQMQEHEDEIPRIVRRLMDNEKDLDTIKRDLNRLAAEKVELSILRQERQEEVKRLKSLSIVTFVIFGLTALLIAVLSYVMEWGSLPIIIVAFLATLAASYIVIRTQDCNKDIQKCDINQNYAITLENRVKIKFVNMKNAVNYTCERFHVANSRELTYNYEQFIEICKEREKLKQVNEDLEYFSKRLVRILKGLNLYDAKIWMNYANAIIDPREMVEIKHELFVRRQNLRNQIDYNLKAIQKMRDDVELYYGHLGSKAPQVRDIIKKVEELNQGLL